MDDLEKKFNNPESGIGRGVDGGKQEEIAQTINAPKVTEESVKEKILNIDNEKIQSILLHCLSEKTLTIEKIDNECDIYNKKIKPKLENEKMSIFFSYLLSKNIKLPPSMLLIELESLETIEKAIELMEDSLEFIYPSKIIGNTDKYIKFASAKDPDEKELISRYFSEKYPIENIYAEYDSYLTIKNMKYSAEEVKEFVLSLIEKGEHPSLVETYVCQINGMEASEAKKYLKGALNLR